MSGELEEKDGVDYYEKGGQECSGGRSGEWEIEGGERGEAEGEETQKEKEERGHRRKRTRAISEWRQSNRERKG